MMRNVLTIFGLLCSCCILQAMPIDTTTAQQKALAFVQSHLSEDTETPTLELAMKSEAFYVFNINEHEGFVMVAGDDQMPDVLGYSDTGTFTPDRIPENMAEWLKSYAAQMEFLRTQPDANPVSHKAVSKTAIAPMLQRLTFNEEMETLFADSLASAGSKATALAEIISYHQQVTSKAQVHTDTITALRDSILSANDSQGIIRTLVNDFDCYDDIHEVKRFFYSSEHWDQIIYRELRDKRPILYCGESQDSTTYAFVIDGYAPDNYFHINWDSEGINNGYFLLSILEEFDDGQYIFAGIQPAALYDIPQAYAILNKNSNALLFYYDCDIDNHPELNFATETYTIKSWRSLAENVQYLSFKESFANYTLYTLDSWCKDCKSLMFFDFVENFNATYATSMDYMFQNCKRITTLRELNKLKTDNVRSMSHVFDGCTNLNMLDISKLNTAKVTRMDGMFYGCTNLKTTDVSFSNTQKVTDMSQMFYKCTNLKELSMATFDTQSVTNMSQLFHGCESLDPNYFIIDIANFITPNVQNMSFMFYNCKTLFWIDMQSVKTRDVTNMASMFQGCTDLMELNLKNFNTRNVKNMNNMFSGCTKLQTIYASEEWSNESLERSNNMFKDCKSLKGGKGTVFDALYTDASYACIDGGDENPGYFTYRQSTDIQSVEEENRKAKGDDGWYTLCGVRLEEEPTQRGVYIHEGRKVLK
ncbi:MAG: BspA family leucine-rich repeat surface protein [Bacteroidaceae bacterium]|nr:BspA family leucine-rich repeat surface protein [Bacteroidaceae bacterium]